MERKGKSCNTDPERARKRAAADLRCAMRKLGIPDVVNHFDAFVLEHGLHDFEFVKQAVADQLRTIADRIDPTRREESTDA